MISLDHAKRSDRLMRATTSLTVPEFDEVAGQFAAVRAAKTAAGTARQRRPGGGRKGCMVSARQKLFFILLYFKAYPTQDVMGLLFGITQGQVSEWVRQLTAVAGQLIPLHRPARQARDLTQLLREQPELQELIIDGTERRSFNIKVSSEGEQGTEITWDAEADFESGIQQFIVLRDGQELAKVPEKPIGKFGRPLFQPMTYPDTPSQPIPEMRYMDVSAKVGEKHTYCVISANGVGLRSEPSIPTP